MVFSDENREDIACFLIRSGCDVNAVRKPGPGGTGGEEASDLMTPLHLCCSWGLEDTVQTLLEHGAKVNAKVSSSLRSVVDFTGECEGTRVGPKKNGGGGKLQQVLGTD